MPERFIVAGVVMFLLAGYGLRHMTHHAPPGTAAFLRTPPRTESAPGPSDSGAEPPFWERAAVPVPVEYREPLSVDPAALGVCQEIPYIHFSVELDRLESTGDIRALNALLLDWMTLDFPAARLWVEAHETAAPFQIALRHFAGRLAAGGDCDFALRWVELIETPEERTRLLTDIYSLGFQTGRFTAADIVTAPLDEPDRLNILNGSRRN